jgi:hypothetical protein
MDIKRKCALYYVALRQTKEILESLQTTGNASTTEGLDEALAICEVALEDDANDDQHVVVKSLVVA